MNHRSDPGVSRRILSGLALLLFIIPIVLSAQPADKIICNKVFSFAYEHLLTEKPVGDIVTAVGIQFLGSPYEEHTLDSGAEENLIVNLHSFDCVTFVENVIALAECIKRDRLSYDEYRKTLEAIRYRGGVRSGYSSRLHYFSEWISDNVQKGFAEDRTKDLHGISGKKTLNYLSRHADHNQQADSVMEKIIGTERNLSAISRYIIPVTDIKSIESEIGNGDLLAITTTVEGLDVGHTGFAVRGTDGSLHLLHASETGGKVEVSSETLQQYLQKHRKDSGIMVVKILAMR